MAANMAQLEYSNNKYYVLAFRYIYRKSLVFPYLVYVYKLWIRLHNRVFYSLMVLESGPTYANSTVGSTN